MTADGPRYTPEQVETMELAPGAKNANLEGWIPALASDDDLRRALEEAFGYRGDVTLTLKGGERIEAFIFDRRTGAALADSQVWYFTPGAPEKRKASYAEIARIEFSGKDCAAGKQWEDWVRKHRERKAAGEKGIALSPEALD
jgi:hypothetical protein